MCEMRKSLSAFPFGTTIAIALLFVCVCEGQSQCDKVHKFLNSVCITVLCVLVKMLNPARQEGVVQAVSRISNSIGYAGLDGVNEWGTMSQNSTCRLKIASLINKAGATIVPSVASAQAAVRSSAIKLLDDSSCPGFGLCGNIQDGSDDDVWPITAISVSTKCFALTLSTLRLIHFAVHGGPTRQHRHRE